jgi:hypothetical protein
VLEWAKPTWAIRSRPHGPFSPRPNWGYPLPPPAHRGSLANPAGRQPEAGGPVVEDQAPVVGPRLGVGGDGWLTGKARHR